MNSTGVDRADAVVVGVDGSAHSGAAVAWAAAVATRHGWPLRMVHAFTWPAYATSYGLPPSAWEASELQDHADDLVAEAVEEARSLAPTCPVTGRVLPGSAAAVLIEQSHRAAMVVVGRRGVGGFAELLLGSVGAQLARHAVAPVVVVPAEPPPGTGRIVVGVDGSACAEQALQFAFREAMATGATVVAVWAGLGGDPGRLAAALDRWRTAYPDVRVEPRTVPVPAVRALLDASADADLLVVGSRGHGGFHDLLLGSTSGTVLHHAPCPVVIVHGK